MATTPAQHPDPGPPDSWTGRTVVDQDGSKLGKLEHVYLDESTNRPTWGVVKAGPLGRRRHFVPLHEARGDSKNLTVPVHRDHVSSAPAVPPDRRLSPETESRLDEHYARRGELREARARQREEHGGFNLGAAFFGWLVAVAMAAILTALLSAIATAIGVSSLNPQEARATADTIGIVAAAVLLAILFLAYFCGGYVAGRMSRFDGARQGLGVWVIGLVVTILLVLLGLIFGSEFNVLAKLGVQPSIPIGEGALTVGGIIALAAFVIATLLGAIVGGKAGERYHRKVDRAGL